jgi:hypothetical protein
MAIKEFNNFKARFEDYLSLKFSYRKLNNLQKIVEFFVYCNGIHEKIEQGFQFPFSRYLRIAKKFNEWAKGDLDKVYGLIWDASIFFDSREMNWTLDTVYRFLPQYLDGKIEHCHEEFNGSDIEEYERQKTKERLDKYRKADESS